LLPLLLNIDQVGAALKQVILVVAAEQVAATGT
jgi:hypothetical protein